MQRKTWLWGGAALLIGGAGLGWLLIGGQAAQGEIVSIAPVPLGSSTPVNGSATAFAPGEPTWSGAPLPPGVNPDLPAQEAPPVMPPRAFGPEDRVAGAQPGGPQPPVMQPGGWGAQAGEAPTPGGWGVPAGPR